MYRIEELEDAIVAAIKEAGYDAKSVNREPTKAEISGETSESAAALVIYDRDEPAEMNFASVKGTDFFFNLVVTARNLSGQSAAERGDATTTGIYGMLNGLKSLLTENSLGLSAQPMVFISEKPLLRTQRISAYAQEWKLTVYE
jgi:hypothetical protein